MAKVKVLLEIEKEVWEAVPTVARFLNLPSDAATSNVASMVFESLVADAYMESIRERTPVGNGGRDVGEAVERLLDPDISVPVTVKEASAKIGESTGLSLAEYFDEVLSQDTHDPWVQAVLAKEEPNDLWKMAIASVYQVIKGDERRLPSTWDLIDRTYRLLKKPLDNGGKRGS